MNEWWVSFLKNSKWEGLYPMNKMNKSNDNIDPHLKMNKLKRTSPNQVMKTSAEIHKDWYSDHSHHKEPNSTLTSQELDRTVTIISKSDVAEIELQWDL